MSVTVTKAALELKTENAEVSPHKLISLLMAGAIERIEHTKSAALANDLATKELLWTKVIAIVNGLKDSLNFDDGGQIANNLNTVYIYLLNRFDEVAFSETELECQEELKCLNEASVLIKEIHEGWNSMATASPEAIAC